MTLPKAPMRITTAFAFSYIGRAIQEGFARRKFGKGEKSEIVLFFGADPPHCVFCGGEPVRRWDHLIAVNQGGETILGNMVPSCAHCDDSKQQCPYAEWMQRDPATSPQVVKDRIAKIEAYVRRYGYKVRPLEARLNPAEAKRLEAIRAKLKQTRTELEQLIREYRDRTLEG